MKGHIARDYEYCRLRGSTGERRYETDPKRKYFHLGSGYILKINSASSKLGSDDNSDLLRLQDVRAPEGMMTLGAVEISCSTSASGDPDRLSGIKQRSLLKAIVYQSVGWLT